MAWPPWFLENFEEKMSKSIEEDIILFSNKERKKLAPTVLQWCAYQNQNDRIYEVIDLFLT